MFYGIRDCCVIKLKLCRWSLDTDLETDRRQDIGWWPGAGHNGCPPNFISISKRRQKLLIEKVSVRL